MTIQNFGQTDKISYITGRRNIVNVKKSIVKKLSWMKKAVKINV